MLRIVPVLLSLTLLAAPAHAACAGRDLIAEMAPEARAALDAAAASVPYAEGNRWRATRGQEMIDLVGTYHVDDPRLDPVLARLEPAIATAAKVLVEAGPAEEAALKDAVARDPSLMFLTTGPTLPEALPEAEWQALAKEMSARGVPAFFASKMRPWFVSMLLGRPACAGPMPDRPEGGLDARIIALAGQKGVPVGALEPYDTAISLLSDMPWDEQLDMIRTSLATAGDAEHLSATLAQSYFNEHGREIWEFGRIQAKKVADATPEEVDAEFARLEEVVMVRRNHAWIPVIETAAAEGPVFVAFGALHLSGPDGVLALLAERGFALERLPF